MEENEIPIACSLSAPDRAERGTELNDTFKHVEQINELPDGYAFKFPGSEALASKLLKVIMGERACCPFFTFELVFEPQEGPIWLHMRGPDGVKEFVKETVGTSNRR